MYYPAVIVHRDSDTSNEYETFGNVEIVEFDYGRSDLTDPGTFASWASSHLDEARLLDIKGFPEVAARCREIVERTRQHYDHPPVGQPYDQLTDRDDLLVAREELQTLYDYEQNNGDESRLHGLDTAITVLGKLIERLPND